MAEEVRKSSRVMWLLGVGFIVLCIFWALSIFGVLPLTYAEVKTPRELELFLNSPKDNMRGVKVNGHFLELGKRPSLQILKGYEDYMFLMRPYRQVMLKSRNMTRSEVFDFCTNINAAGLDDLREKVQEGKGYTPVWGGTIHEKKIEIIKVTLFSYLVVGLSEKAVFLSQVELAGRLGMDDSLILQRIIPVQRQWYEQFMSSEAAGREYPLTYILPMKDQLISWLAGHRS
ncbi:MAG TPA: hypothetical protein ENN05_06050 [Deltaproteobacteria bacterium]|nr:hypothetical protein [Deltaproteobacteria bacterium]